MHSAQPSASSCDTLCSQEEEFQQKWKLLKQGKNKPLEADEVEFLEGVAEHEARQERLKRESDALELQSFQLLREQALVRTAALPSVGGPVSTTVLAPVRTERRAADAVC